MSDEFNRYGKVFCSHLTPLAGIFAVITTAEADGSSHGWFRSGCHSISYKGGPKNSWKPLIAQEEGVVIVFAAR